MVFGLLLTEIKAVSSPKEPSKEGREAELSQKIEVAKELLAANGIQSRGLWCIDDIIDKAKELKKRCSIGDARSILDNIEQNFDAEYGITWQTKEQSIEDYFQDKKTKAK